MLLSSLTRSLSYQGLKFQCGCIKYLFTGDSKPFQCVDLEVVSFRYDQFTHCLQDLSGFFLLCTEGKNWLKKHLCNKC